MTQTPIQKCLASVARSIAAIGKKNGTVAPDLDLKERNNEKAALLHDQHDAAYQYLVDSAGYSHFEKARKMSKKKLEELGMLDGAAKVKPGDPSTILWQNEHMQLQVKINNPSIKVDTTTLISALRRRGVSKEVIDACVNDANVENKAPMFISVVPTTNGGDA